MTDRVQRALEAPRWGRGRFLLVWIVLALGSWVAPFFVVGAISGGEEPTAVAGFAAGAVFLVFHVAKLLAVIRRLADLGRPPDDAFWLFVPVMNFVLIVWLLGRTPAADRRERRIRAWAGADQTGGLEAYGRALPRLRATLATGVGGAVLYAGLFAVSEHLVLAQVRDLLATGEGAETLVSGLWLLLIALGLYAGLQLVRRERVARGSWLPVLFLVPTMIWLGVFAVAPHLPPDQGAVALAFLIIGWLLGPGSVLLGLVSALWIAADEQLDVPSGEGLGSRVRSTWADVAVAYGTRNHLVQLGGIVVIPGILFAVSYAFSDLVAALRPGRPFLKGSTQLVRGIRAKIFVMLGVYWLASSLLYVVGALPIVGIEGMMAAMVDPTSLPLSAMFVRELATALVAWWSVVALLHVFRERDALLVAKLERDRAAATQAATERATEARTEAATNPFDPPADPS